MAKKSDKKSEEKASAPPKFGGFHPLAGGLEGFKAKLDAEKANEKKAAENAAREKARPRPAPAASSSSARPAPRSANEADDEMTFHRMMSGVVPLAEGGKSRVPVTAEVKKDTGRADAATVAKRAQAEAEKAIEHLHSLVDDAARFEVTDDGRRVEGRRVDTPPDLVRNLRRGRLPIDGRLDLHGLSAVDAREKVVEFLRTMRARGERCVLVIHGKGDRVPGGGVLRGEIAAWLSQGKARESVAAFATASDADGGEGAVYVALRR